MRDFVHARCREAGNILFMILITVILFAALSYAVTQSSRGGSKDASSEIRKLDIAQIIQYGTQISQAITRLTTIGGCVASADSGNTITFQYDTDGDGDWNDNDEIYHNPHAPTNHSCHIFHPEGGGVSFRSWEPILESPANEENYNAGNFIQNVGTTCGNASCKELIYLISIDPDVLGAEAFCRAMNDELGVSNPGGSPPVDTNIWSGQRFVGTYEDNSTGFGDGGEAPEIHGQHSGCIQETTGGGNWYRFYYVLVER